MMPALPEADQDLLHKLLLGQLPSAEIERLAAEYADDSRLAELAETLAGKDDALLDLLRHHETGVDAAAERLVERLLERLRLARQDDETGVLDSSPYSAVSGEPAAQPLPERLEYFRPLKVLGQGGMGTVYLALDTRLGREVALKTLRPELAANAEAKERFLREARTAAKLEHDHIIQIYYVGEAGGTPFLAMPLLKGESLQALLERSAGPLPVAQAVRLAREAAAGLAAAHGRGLIHRDIKPANLWLEAPGGRVKVLDFGLAHSLTEDVHLTAIGAILGTPAYMAPEQARGLPVDHRADLFSLGCVLYEMLTSQRPFAGADTMAILSSLAVDTPPAPHALNPRCPSGLSQLVMSLLEKTPDSRPASAQEVVLALADVDSSATEHVPIQAATPQVGLDAPADTAVAVQPPPRAPSPRRRRLPVLAVAALLLALVSVGIFFGGQIIRVVTNQGELVVEVDDPAVALKIVQNGLVVQDKTSKREFTLSAGKGEIEVLEKDGIKLATKKFELTRGGKTTVNVTLQELADARKPLDPGPAVKKDSPAIPADTDPDRRAAKWVLSIGGTLTFKENGKDWQIGAVGDLPRGAFELTDVNVAANAKVSDAGLAHFKDCKNLTSLVLSHNPVSDAGLVHFKDCKNLTTIQMLDTQLSDAGLAHFKDWKNLAYLHLCGTQVSDAGLAHFKDCKNLAYLNLHNTQVSDAGLPDLASLSSSIELNILGTRISLRGHEQLKTAMPKCNITWSETNRGVAETVLALGGTVEIGTPGQPQSRPIKSAADLPRDYFQVRRVSLAGVARPLDDLPEQLSWLRFPEFDRLESIDLSGVKLSNYGFLAPMHGLRELLLANAGLNDDKLADLPKLPALKRLVIDGNDIRSAGLAYLSGRPRLIDLSLGCPSLTDILAKKLAELKQVKRLSLAGSGLTDDGIKHLAGLTNLERLDLRRTEASAAGIDELRKALPKCQIDWGGTKDK